MINKNAVTSQAGFNKPPLRRTKSCKIPEIRQTLTSKLRILKANPILSLGIRTEDLDFRKPLDKTKYIFPELTRPEVKTLPGNLDRVNESAVNGNGKSASSQQFDQILSKNGAVRKNIPIPNTSQLNSFSKSSIKFSSSKIASGSEKNRLKKEYEKSETIWKTRTAIANSKTEEATSKPQKSNQNGRQIRRSLSAQHFDRKKGKNRVDPKDCYQKNLDTSRSMNDIRTQWKSVISPVVEENLNVFKSPFVTSGKSIAFPTPSTSKFLRFAPYSSTPSANKDLHQRLNEWLKKKGKHSNSYHHLKCFGVPNSIDPENKENVEVVNLKKECSYEELRIENPMQIPEINFEEIAKEALDDLLKLILEGYSKDQCEAWLGIIREKYEHLDDEPQYWECRAAIEQIKGNISSAVQCYRTALVHGADISVVDKSLDQLLHKFDLLNIASQTENNTTTRDRARIVQDARNVFKSSIIQFAIQEKKMKNKAGKPVSVLNDKPQSDNKLRVSVTPVRRSTRLNRSGFVSTPGIQLCNSLRDLTDDLKDNMEFQSNHALV